MKMLFVSDSFKGTLTSKKTAQLLGEAAREVFPGCETDALPVADGGEGTVEAVTEAAGGRFVEADVTGPLGKPVRAVYGIVGETRAVIEMAAASGLPLLAPAERDPLAASTAGTGELILHALDGGIRDIFIAIGGSATNDGGMGCMRVLGARFLDGEGNSLQGSGADLERVVKIDLTALDPRLKETTVTVMCDVDNPLCGERGATYTYGPQKGAEGETLARLERGMCNYRDVIRSRFGTDPDTIPGSGAAGGLGCALTVFLNGTMRSGISVVLELTGFEDRLQGVDLVVTGEGRTDMQSCFGKVMQGVGERAAALGVPVVGLSGSLGSGADALFAHGVESLMTCVDAPMPLSEAMERAEELYRFAAVRMFRLLRTGMRMAQSP